MGLQQLPQNSRRQAVGQIFAIEHDYFFALVIGELAAMVLMLKDSVNESRGDTSQSRGDEPLGLSKPECSAAITTTVDQRGHWVVPETPEQSRMINPGSPESSAIIRRVKVPEPYLSDAADWHRGRGPRGR
ncbi:MAG: hypothetical protein ABI024_04615 [Vicinamibacterales bacterium]